MRKPIVNIQPSQERVTTYLAAVDTSLRALEDVTWRAITERVSQNDTLDLQWLIGRMDGVTAELSALADALKDAKIGVLPPATVATLLENADEVRD